MGSKKVCILDLIFENIYVKCSTELNKRIIREYKDLDYILKYRILKGNKISLKLLRKIIRHTKINLAEVEKNLELVTSNKATDVGIKKPKLFIDLKNKELARFVASILGDGNLNSNLMVDYNNKKKTLINLIIASSKKAFGDVDTKIYYGKGSTYHLHFPKIIGIYLFHLGLSPGYKSNTNQKIPSFIFCMNKEGKSAFLRQFYNDEGNVRRKDRRLQIKQTIKIEKVNKKILRDNIERYAPNILKDVKQLLLEFGIKSKISLGCYREDKSDWELSIYGKENLELFRDNINFDLKYKNKLLSRCIGSYRFPSAPRNGRIDFAIEKCRLTQNKYRYITKYLLAKESNRSLKVATYYLVDLKKKNLIKIIEKPKNKSEHHLPIKYRINRAISLPSPWL